MAELFLIAVADGDDVVIRAVADTLAAAVGQSPRTLIGVALRELLHGPALPAFDRASPASPASLATPVAAELQWPGDDAHRVAGSVQAVRLEPVDRPTWLIRFAPLPRGADGRTLSPIATMTAGGLANAMPALVFAATPQGGAAYVNAGWLAYTGVATDGSLAATWRALVHPDDQVVLVERWRRAAAAGTPFEAEFRLRRADGEYRWHLARAELARDAAGRPLIWTGIATDIERQKRIEEALDAREREFRTLVENAPDVIVRMDRALRIQYANRALASAFGVASEDARDEPDRPSLVPQAVLAQWRQQAAAAIATGAEQECAFSLERAGGAHFVSRVIPELDRAGRPDSLLIITYDITQRRRAQAAFHESERRFRQFADSTDDVFWLADRASGRLLYLSAAVERLCGIARAELQRAPQRWADAIVGPDAPAWPLEAPDRAPQEDRPWVREYRLRTASGGLRWMRDRRFVVSDDRGAPARVGGIIEDITDRVAREREREDLLARERSAREDAEALSRSKDEFLAVVSHELRSPLNAIRGWAHVLRQAGDLGPAQQRALDAIDRNTQAQARLIDDLLDMQRALRGKLALETRLAQLAGVVEQAADSVRPTLQAKPVTLTLEHDPAVGLVRVDVDRLRQVVANLLSNAAKFTPAGGSITVRTRRVDDALVRIEVSDTGAGIAPELLPHVFDRFRQGDASTTRRHGGLGLGLALARQLVEQHGGRLWAASPGVGQGSVFTAELPAPRQAGALPAAPRTSVAALPALLADRTILVVEDEADSRDMLTLLLREAGAQVQACAGAAAAFEALGADRRARADAVVSDIAMPGEDGHSLLRRVRALEAAHDRPRVPAVALTAFAAPADRDAALAAGFDAHLPKPIDARQLVEVLAGLLAAARGGRQELL